LKVKLDVGIYGVPAKLNLSAKILYGEKENFESKVFRKEFSLDKGGSIILDLDYFIKFAEQEKLTRE
jgi:hypothetical protein